MREREVWRNNNKIIAIRRVKERLRKIVLVSESYIGRECGRGIKRKRERERVRVRVRVKNKQRVRNKKREQGR